MPYDPIIYQRFLVQINHYMHEDHIDHHKHGDQISRRKRKDQTDFHEQAYPINF